MENTAKKRLKTADSGKNSNVNCKQNKTKARKEEKPVTVTVYMGNKRLQKEEYKNYICVSDYVANLVNEVYYSKIDDFRKREYEKQKQNCG